MEAIEKLTGREKRIHWEVTLQLEVGGTGLPAVPGGEGGAERAGQFLGLLKHPPPRSKMHRNTTVPST